MHKRTKIKGLTGCIEDLVVCVEIILQEGIIVREFK